MDLPYTPLPFDDRPVRLLIIKNRVSDPPLTLDCSLRCSTCPILILANKLLDFNPNTTALTTFTTLKAIGIHSQGNDLCASFVNWYNSTLEQKKLKAILDE